MKVEVVVKFDESERSFEIPCGLGDKTFKWLGQVASQRFANSAPNGNLRRREGNYGISERVQYQTMTIITPGGENPFPGDMLQDYLRDGDTVIIELCSRLAVDTSRGTPQISDYATLAYSVSQESLNGYHSEEDISTRYGKSSPTRSTADLRIGIPADSGTKAQHSQSSSDRLAKVNFMRVMAKSQMLNEKKIDAAVQQHWLNIQSALKLLKTDDSPKIRSTFAEYWDMLKDLFKHYSSDSPTMLKDQYVTLIDEANVFPAMQVQNQASLAFVRALKHMPNESNTINFNFFLLSLLFCAQLKYNDTLDPKLASLKSYEAVSKLVVCNLLPLARRLECHSILRAAFIHADCLVKIREQYELLQGCFDKIASKLRDFPTTITVEETTELLFQAGLVVANTDHESTRRYLLHVREGTIFGRGIDIEDSNAADFPITELTFPEFLDVLCRAGYYYFVKNPPSLMSPNPSSAALGPAVTTASTNNLLSSVPSAVNLAASPSLAELVTSTTALDLDRSDAYQTQIIDYFYLGIVSLCDFITGKKVKPPPTAKEGKRKKGQQ
jgi:hypothetical protein